MAPYFGPMTTMTKLGLPLLGVVTVFVLSSCTLDTPPNGHANTLRHDAGSARDGGGTLVVRDAGRRQRRL